MTHKSLLANTIEGLRLALRAGNVSFEEACELQHQRFAEMAQSYGCVIRQIDEPWSRDLPFAGVGVAHKDIFEQDGYLPGLGRDRGSPDPAATLAAAPAALRASGMTQLGTLSMAEDACSATAYTRKLPVPLNPVDQTLAVGGSSSGSAVAVACGMVYASLGTDTAGSVRIPSMTCGVMGLKTTHALVDRTGMTIVCPSLDSIGVLARSSSDLRSVINILAPALPNGSERRLRVGHWDAFDAMGSGAGEIAELVRCCFAQYSDKEVQGVMPHFECASHHVQVMMSSEVASTQSERIRADLACEEVRQLGLTGRALPADFYRQSCLQRPGRLQMFLDEVFGDIDVLMLPLQLQPLPRTDQVYPGAEAFSVSASLSMHRMCGWINYLGLPALAMPIGRDCNGRSVSIQMVARPRHELSLLQVGELIQNDLYGPDGIVPCEFKQEE